MQINNEGDLIDSLSKFAKYYSDFMEGDNSAWKWCCIALYMALQNTFVIHLHTTNPFGSLKWELDGKKLDFNSMTPEERVGIRFSKLKLHDFLTLYKQAKSFRQYVDSEALPQRKDWNSSVKALHIAYRNPLIHLSPVNGYIDYSDTTSVYKSCLEVMCFLIYKGKKLDRFFYRNSNKEAFVKQISQIEEMIGSSLVPKIESMV